MPFPLVCGAVSWAPSWVRPGTVVGVGAQGILPQLAWGVQGFPGGAGVKNPPANAGDKGSSPGLGRSHMPRSN